MHQEENTYHESAAKQLKIFSANMKEIQSATSSIRRRKQRKPVRSIKPVQSRQEKKIQGIIKLNFTFKTSGIDQELKDNRKTLSNSHSTPDIEDYDELKNVGNTGVKSFKFTFDANKSINELTARSHAKAIGLLSRKGKIGAPMDITRMEFVDDLNEEEFHICSVLRITPAQYLKAKETLVAESSIRGYFKKSAAQKMLRMDVNKTGKLYDYFTMINLLPFQNEKSM